MQNLWGIVSEYRHHKMVKRILKSPMRKNIDNDSINEILKQACVNGNLKLTKSLVSHGVNIHYKNNAPLRYASEKGYSKIVQYLLAQGADKDAFDGYALINACSNNHIDVVEILLNSGANINKGNGLALKLALKNGNTEIIKLLENQKINQNITINTNINLSKPKLNKYKIDFNKIYLKVLNSDGIHHGFQYRTGLNVLIGTFAETGSCASGGLYVTDPKHVHNFLNYGRYVHIVKIPQDNDIKCVPNGDDKWRFNKIILCEEKYDLHDESTFDKLVELGAKISDLKTGYIYWACRYGQLNIIQKIGLEKYSFAPNTLQIFIPKALRLACLHGHCEVIKYLFEKTCQSLDQYFLPFTPLKMKGQDIRLVRESIIDIFIMACYNNKIEIVKYFFLAGATMHETLTNNNKLILKNICTKGHDELLKILLINGLKISLPNEYIDLAEKNNHTNIVQIIFCQMPQNQPLRTNHIDNVDIIDGLIMLGYSDRLLKFNKFQWEFFTYDNLVKIFKADIKVIKHIIDNSVDLEYQDQNNLRPIHIICRLATSETIKLIIEKGVDLECENNKKWRPIHIICAYGTRESIRLLVDKKVNLDCESIDGVKPFHLLFDRQFN